METHGHQDSFTTLMSSAHLIFYNKLFQMSMSHNLNTLIKITFMIKIPSIQLT